MTDKLQTDTPLMRNEEIRMKSSSTGSTLPTTSNKLSDLITQRRKEEFSRSSRNDSSPL